MTYAQLLRDPRWQRKRLEIMQRDGFKCRHCGDGTMTLNVHHKEYIKGRKPWEYENEQLLTLCEECHEIEHLKMTPLERIFFNMLRDFDLRRGDTRAVRILNQIAKLMIDG